MNLKKVLLIALAASAGVSTAPTFAGSNTATIKGDHNPLIYQITGIKGKAIVELPSGKRLIAKPGMKVAHGSRISVLENSVLQGFDIQNQCQVEYRECINRPLYQDQLCARVTVEEVVAVQPAAETYVSQTVAAAPTMTSEYVVPVIAGGSLGLQGANFAPYLVGLGGSALLAAVLHDDNEVNITNNNSDSNNNANDGGNNSGGNNDNNNANDGGNNSGGNNDNDGGINGGNSGGNNVVMNDDNNANDGGNNSGGNNDNAGGNNGGNAGGNNDNAGGNNGGNAGGNNDNAGGNDGGNAGGNNGDNNDGKDDGDGKDDDKDDGKDDDKDDGADMDGDGKPVSH